MVLGRHSTLQGQLPGPATEAHLHSMWSILCIDHIRHLVCIECVIFWYPVHTCYVWDQAVQQPTGKKNQVRLVHSLLKYFFLFQLWYWIQIYTTKYSNLLLIILILVWIVCSTYRKGEILMQKWHVTSQFVYCYIIHAILTKWSRSATEGAFDWGRRRYTIITLDCNVRAVPVH